MAEKPELSKIIGLDSEAYTDGRPFMFATSLQDVILPEQIPDIFFIDEYINANFVTYNLKYDSGAVLRFLPLPKMRELWETNKTIYNKYIYEYIPHKRLRIAREGCKKERVDIWDIAQFYKMKLDTAAKRYLGESKLDQRTKRYTREYVKRCWKSISRYCIQDAILVQKLAVFLIDKLKEFDIRTTDLFSQASISAAWVKTRMEPFTAHKWYYSRHKTVAYACDSYRGGKFEMTARGRAYTYEYDITSAYPYEITKLLDISKAEHLESKDYQKDAVYGFLRVKIDNSEGKYLPCGIFKNGTVVYPRGTWYATITKKEYEYMAHELNIPIEIHDAVWLFVKRKRYPFREPFLYLYSIKDRYKNSDKMLYGIIKILMNGYYGKMVQVIEDHEGTYKAGSFFNPIYGSVITANTRISICRMQNRLGPHCLAVHTDSVITDEPVELTKEGLGKYKYETEGDSVLITSGMYQIKNTSKLRGFLAKVRKNKRSGEFEADTWLNILERFPNRSKIKYKQLRVNSWVECMAKNWSQDKINLFEDTIKEIDLNCDIKRHWPKAFKAKDFLTTLQHSEPLEYFESQPPKEWEIKIPWKYEKT